jgi:hypothetical protein
MLFLNILHQNKVNYTQTKHKHVKINFMFLESFFFLINKSEQIPNMSKSLENQQRPNKLLN